MRCALGSLLFLFKHSSSVYLWYPKTMTVGYSCMGEIPSQKMMGLRGRFWMCWDRRGLEPELCWLYLKPTPQCPQDGVEPWWSPGWGLVGNSFSSSMVSLFV